MDDYLIPKGNSTMTAVVHRRNVSVTGGIELESPRATIKLPDQIAVAAKASKKPVKGGVFRGANRHVSPFPKDNRSAGMHGFGTIRRGDPRDRPIPQIKETGEHKIRPYDGHFVSILSTARRMHEWNDSSIGPLDGYP